MRTADEDMGLMVGSGPQAQLDETDYAVIESALAETERGRRFLAEFARRHRGADTDTLLQAIRRLEGVVTKEAVPVAGSNALRDELAAMAESIARTRSELAVITSPEGQEGHALATESLDTLIDRTERATSEILGAAEAIQEAAWGLRETGADSALCDLLDRRAITLYAACSVQDLSARRTGLVVATLHDLETRIAALIGHAATPAPASERQAPAAARPPLPDAHDHDLDFVQSPPEGDASAAAPRPEPAVGEPDDLALAFADLDKLSIDERIALFS